MLGIHKLVEWLHGPLLTTELGTAHPNLVPLSVAILTEMAELASLYSPRCEEMLQVTR